MEQNKVQKYILYALGEIFLVVIGILIALQINNWNEKQKEAQIVNDIFHSLIQDFEEDLADIESLKELVKGRKEHADYLLTVIQRSEMEIDSARTIIALTRVGWILNYSPAFSTYNEITNSGRLSLIESVELKKSLADYKSQVFDNTRIEESYEPGLKEAELIALSFLSQVPDENNLFSGIPESINDAKIDVGKMKRNERFINHLKHISFYSGNDVLYKDSLIAPRAKAILEILKTELESRD